MFDALIDKLHSGRWLTLEITPPKGAMFQQTIEKIRALDLIKFIDAFTVTDNPLAKLKYGSLFA